MQALQALPELQKSVSAVLEKWNAIMAQEISAMNAKLRDAKLPELKDKVSRDKR